MTRSSTEIINRIRENLDRVVLYRSDIKDLLLFTAISRGHLLIEGKLGTAKTLLAHTFARLIAGTYHRIQGTSDMLPADITGFYHYQQVKEGEFIKGPVFANIVMVDELNRLSPRTQSALLEAMQEHQVTVEGITHPLPLPFMIIASQVPYGGAGTSVLPDVQADRFMLRAWSDYPKAKEELDVLKDIDRINDTIVEPVVSLDELSFLHEAMLAVHTADGIREYIVEIVNRLRTHPDVFSAPSVRGSIALLYAARALALTRERDFVLPDDIKELAVPALYHRLHLTPEADTDGITPDMLISQILEEVPVPRV